MVRVRDGVAPSALALEQLDARSVAGLCEHVEQIRGNSARTRNARLAAMRSFMRFVEYRVPAYLEQSRQIHAIPTKRTDTKLVDHPDRAQIERS